MMETDPPIQELMDFVGEHVREDAAQKMTLNFDIIVSSGFNIVLNELSDKRVNVEDRLWMRFDDGSIEVYIEAAAWELHFLLAAIRRYVPKPKEKMYVGTVGGAGGGANASGGYIGGVGTGGMGGPVARVGVASGMTGAGLSSSRVRPDGTLDTSTSLSPEYSQGFVDATKIHFNRELRLKAPYKAPRTGWFGRRG